MKFSYLAAVRWVSAFAVTEWVRVPGAMQVLLIFMAFDYVTGIMSAVVCREVSSSKAWRGLVRKGLILMLLTAAIIGQRMAGIDLHVEQAGAVGFTVSEFISIIENCAKAGVPIPAALVSALVAAKKLRRAATPEEIKDLESEP